MIIDRALKYGAGNLQLYKSEHLIAVSARNGSEESLRAELAQLGSPDPLTMDEFFIVDVRQGLPNLEDGLEILRANPSVAAGSHVYHTSSDEVPLVPNGLVYVVFREDAAPRDCQDLLRASSLQLISARGARRLIVRITSASDNPLKVSASLQASELVEIAEPEIIAEGMTSSVPSDSLISDMWHLQNVGSHRGTELGFTPGADARVMEAWKEFGIYGRQEVIIAVVDDGFDLMHPDLVGQGKVASPWDFIRNTNDPSPDPLRRNWHGTACAGVAVGNANGTGIVGAAPNCRLMPLRWNGTLTDENIEAWFAYAAANGAAIISCSWGAKARNYPLSTRKIEAISRCVAEGRQGLGCVVCFAADNYGRNIDDAPNESVNGFACHPDVIAVSASTSLDESSHYSSFGNAVWVCAPSSGAGGWGVTTSDVTGTFLRDGVVRHAGYDEGAFTNDFGGTSSACPLVAGVCGLLLSYRPSLTALQVKDVLRRSARRIGPPQSYDGNAHSPNFGFGCVNALDAMRLVVSV